MLNRKTSTVTTSGDGLCCCSGSGGGCDCPCCTSGYWTQWTFTITGMANQVGGTCDCPSYNGTWTVKYRGYDAFAAQCIWTTDENQTTGACGNGPVWTLGLGTDCFVTLTSQEGSTQLSLAAFDCISDGQVLSGGPLGGQCLPTLMTTTLHPGGVFVPCP